MPVREGLKIVQGLMKGKRGLIMGVANDHSVAWGIAEVLAKQGAELIFTCQNEAFSKRVKRLAASVGSEIVLHCDVEDKRSLDLVFDRVREEWGSLDFLVHAIAFSSREELKGRYADTSRENFVRTMLVSCFSFTEAARRAVDLMPDGGSMVTMTYGGSTRVMPNYNVMGLAKAALESSVRYLAVDFGSVRVRINAISAGPMRTLAGAGIADARMMFNYQKRNSPLRRSVSLEEVGNTALYLLSDLSTAVTGEIVFVDSGYSVLSMPSLEEMKLYET